MTELVVGLIGHPVAHSRSPEIFGDWRRERQVTGRYELIDVPPAALAAALETAWDDGWHGLNVTIPHKRAALAFAEPTPVVRATGATNCLIRTESGWRADNTDGQGLIEALERDGTRLTQGQRVVILGGGGAARAAAYALGQICHVFVVSRRPVSLAGAAEWRPWTDPPLAGASLLINCTSIGMSGGQDVDLGWDHLPWGDLPADALVFDLVYEPLNTPLLMAARRRGHPTLDGLSMLVRQGILSYERWLKAAGLQAPDKVDSPAAATVAGSGRLEYLDGRFGGPFIDLREFAGDEDALSLVPQEVASEHCICPVRLAGSRLIVAMTHSSNVAAINHLAALTGLEIGVVVATGIGIRVALAERYGPSEESS